MNRLYRALLLVASVLVGFSAITLNLVAWAEGALAGATASLFTGIIVACVSMLLSDRF